MTRKAEAQVGLFIGRSEETEQLYKSEALAAQHIRDAALELAKLFHWHTEAKDGEPAIEPGGWQDVLFWDKALPQELLAVLQHYESSASEAAATAYLVSHGFKVERVS